MSPRTDLERLDRLAFLLDERFEIPIIRYRVGYDGLIGLIPGIGDLVAFVISAYIVTTGARMGVQTRTTLTMILNVLLETLVGSVPVLGDVFDFTWKANARNVHLIKKDLGVESEPPSQRGLAALLITVLVLIVLGGLAIIALAGLLAWFIASLI